MAIDANTAVRQLWAEFVSDLARERSRGLPGALAHVRLGRHELRACIGERDPADQSPMREDAVFRVYSMTKPLTALCVLRLYERGALDLDDCIDALLPELKDVMVGPPGQLRRPARRITWRDLLRHTAGFGGGVHSTPWVAEQYTAAGVAPFDHDLRAYEGSVYDLLQKLAHLPLAHEPGSTWEYSRSFELIVAALERRCGLPFDQLFAREVCAPLGLVDTGFSLTHEQLGRLAQPAASERSARGLIPLTRTPRFLSGGSGAYSTLADYLRVCQLLCSFGELSGLDFLSPSSIAELTRDQLEGVSSLGPDYIPGEQYGFGLGLATRLRPLRLKGGRETRVWWWLGRAGTCFVVAPDVACYGVLMAQRYGESRPLLHKFLARIEALLQVSQPEAQHAFA